MTEALRIEVVPEADEIAAFYEAVSREPLQESMYRSPFQRKRLARIKELLGTMLSGDDRVLEVGCCDGKLTTWLAERANSVVAVDISPHCIARCEALGLDNVAFVCGTPDDVLNEGDEFDLVIASEVLEHMPDPQGMVKRLGSIAPVILATAPIAEHPNANAFSVEAFHNPRKPGDGTGHIWYFRPDTFKALFEDIVWYEEIDGVSAIVVGR